jgi:hypothetical protein
MITDPVSALSSTPTRCILTPVGRTRELAQALDDEWVIAWSYSDPHAGNPQLTGFGNAGPQAIDVFVQSRLSREKQGPLVFDSREGWARGSV